MAPTPTVYDLSTGSKLGALVREEAAHFVYTDRKGRFFLARRDRSEVRGA